jgi:nucleoside-specific outer membrane channel protein Tsx
MVGFKLLFYQIRLKLMMEYSIHSYGKNKKVNQEECDSFAIKRHFLQQFVFFRSNKLGTSNFQIFRLENKNKDF